MAQWSEPGCRTASSRDDRAEPVLDLFDRWRTQEDRRARDEIFRRHLPLARGLALRYRSALEPIEDLIQVAGLGLLAAMDRFDPARGESFPAFAVPTILGELRRHFRDTGWAAHVPRPAQELTQRIEAASRELIPRAGRAPTLNEIAEYLEITTEDVLVGLSAAAAKRSVSLDAPVRAEPISLADTLGAPDDRFALVDMRLALSAAVRRLPLPERHALVLRLQGDLKQSEIAERLGCSQMQVSRLLRHAADALRVQHVL